MEIIKSIRTWKPSGRKKTKDKLSSKSLSEPGPGPAENCGPVLIHQTSLNGNEHYVSIASLKSSGPGNDSAVFKVPASPSTFQRQTCVRGSVSRGAGANYFGAGSNGAGPLTKPPPHFLQPKPRDHNNFYQESPSLCREPVSNSICPSCREPFDGAKKRRLIDNCGHERCYSCMFSRETCTLCNNQGYDAISPQMGNDFSPFRRSYTRPSGSPATRSCQSELSPMRSLRSTPQSPSVQPQARVFATPPAPRRRYIPSPKPNRPNWMQRHLRRPNTVNVDDATLSDDNSSGRASTRGSIRRPEGHLTAAHFARSCSLGVPRASSTNPSSLGQESGFQSSTSLNSLGGGQQQRSSLRGRREQSPLTSQPATSLLGNQVRSSALESSGSGSMASLVSGFQSGIFSTSGVSNSGKRQSLTNINNLPSKLTNEESQFGNRATVARHSARLPSAQERQNFVDPRVQFAQYCQQPNQQWILKPLFFEVPQREQQPLFVGRQWLYGEALEHLTSDLPTNRGVIVTGAAGTGKTAVILKLVEISCFGRGEPIYQEVNGNSLRSGMRQSSSSSSIGNQIQNQMQSVASQVVAYHFCQHDNSPTCSVPEFVHSIAAQMSQSPAMKSYYQLVMSDNRIRSKLAIPSCTSDPDGSFVHGILEPLKTLQGQGSLGSNQCIILVDGLEESEEHRPDHGDTIGTFIAKHLHSFPSWLKIICTVRSDSISMTRGLPFHQISLDKSDVDERVKKDMVDFIGTRLRHSVTMMTNITPISGKMTDGSPASRFSQYLTERVHGSYLFAKLVLDLIERGHLVIKSTSFKVLPVSLAEVFMLEFNLKFATVQSFHKVSDMLAVCLAALRPMTVTEIFHAVNALAVNGELTWPDFVNRFNALSGFLVRRADDTVMFYHNLFREWLINRRESEPEKFLCDPRFGHLAIALSLCRQEEQLTPDKTLDLSHHILKANIYHDDPFQEDHPSRQLQSVWMALGADDLSAALGSHTNIYCPNAKISRLLLLSGANANYVTSALQNAPLLQVYAHQGFEEMVSLLIEFRVNVNGQNAEGMTALMSACQMGHGDTARLLVQHGAQVNATDHSDRCSLVYAAEGGHLDTVELLVSCDWHCQKKTDLSLKEAAQQATVIAAANGKIEVLEYLLDMSEVDIDGNDTLCGDTPLCAAAAAGQKSACDVLIRRGGKISATNLKENPPLHLSNRHGHWSVADSLLKEGADPEQPDGSGRTPLMIASLEGHLGLVELLLSRGSNMEAQDRDGLSALCWACLKGQLDTATFLLRQNADLSHADKSGRTPLDLAAYKGNPDVVNLLLDHGANMEHVDLNGMRPLDRAISCRNASAVQCFLKKGAKLGPATWAMANGKPDIMLLLLNKLLEDGNTLFKKDLISEAAHRYQYALRRIPSAASTGSGNSNRSTGTKTTFDQLSVHLLLNLSRCKRKCGQFVEALELADRVLSIQPSSFEAHYAKAKANREAGRLHAALQDLTEAMRVAPQNREVNRIILRIKEEINSQNRAASSTSCTSSSSSESACSPPPHMPSLKSTNISDKFAMKMSTEIDSTSGVDSTGSSGCTKDFENENLSTSMVI